MHRCESEIRRKVVEQLVEQGEMVKSSGLAIFCIFIDSATFFNGMPIGFIILS